jgi:hypothetical protein
VSMPSSHWSRPLGRSNPPAARDDCGLGRRGQRQPVVPGFGVVVAGSPLPQLDLGTTAPPPATGVPCLSCSYAFGTKNFPLRAGSRRGRRHAGSSLLSLGEDNLYNPASRVCSTSGNGTIASPSEATPRPSVGRRGGFCNFTATLTV